MKLPNTMKEGEEGNEAMVGHFQGQGTVPGQSGTEKEKKGT